MNVSIVFLTESLATEERTEELLLSATLLVLSLLCCFVAGAAQTHSTTRPTPPPNRPRPALFMPAQFENTFKKQKKSVSQACLSKLLFPNLGSVYIYNIINASPDWPCKSKLLQAISSSSPLLSSP